MVRFIVATALVVIAAFALSHFDQMASPWLWVAFGGILAAVVALVLMKGGDGLPWWGLLIAIGLCVVGGRFEVLHSNLFAMIVLWSVALGSIGALVASMLPRSTAPHPHRG